MSKAGLECPQFMDVYLSALLMFRQLQLYIHVSMNDWSFCSIGLKSLLTNIEIIKKFLNLNKAGEDRQHHFNVHEDYLPSCLRKQYNMWRKKFRCVPSIIF